MFCFGLAWLVLAITLHFISACLSERLKTEAKTSIAVTGPSHPEVRLQHGQKELKSGWRVRIRHLDPPCPPLYLLPTLALSSIPQPLLQLSIWTTEQMSLTFPNPLPPSCALIHPLITHPHDLSFPWAYKMVPLYEPPLIPKTCPCPVNDTGDWGLFGLLL